MFGSRALRPLPMGLLVMGLGVWATPATATIVWNGKVVSSWPNIQGPALATSDEYRFAGANFFPHPTGTVKGLTLLVDFSDQAGAFTQQEISDWLNLEGYSRFGCNGSVRDYFSDVSNGVVDLQNTVRAYYRAKNPKSYYEGGSGYERADELIQELLAAVDADVDFSQYDNDKDGSTESISVVYAGPSVTWGQGLWPHSGWLGQKRDGVTLERYQMTNMGTSLGLYVFAHETGHMLFGWPDLYGFGDYCLMGNYSSPTNPTSVNDFFRADQGWIPLVDITATTNATFAAPANGTSYRYVNPARSNELYFWSNVQNQNRWAILDGSGLLMLHYDGSIDGNNPPNPLELAVVQADGKKDLDATTWPSPGSDPNDFFRGGYRTEFSSTTTPKSSWNDGSASGLRVYAIGATGASMQFSVGDGSAGGTPSTGGASGTGGAPSGGGATGGVATGGIGAGGIATGGIATGGIATGGIATGGIATGGVAMGGIATGGRVGTGGSSAGGTAAGGRATGGLGTGGSATGGLLATGGSTSTGGSSVGTGGAPSGGQAVGGAAGRSPGTTGGSGLGGSVRSTGGSAGTSTDSRSEKDGGPFGSAGLGEDASGCNCSVPHSPRRLPWALGWLLGLFALRRASRRVSLPKAGR